MARTSFEGKLDQAVEKDQLTFQAHGEDRIDLPSSEFISDAHMTRDGDNLILETPNGEVAVIEGYFAADPSPLLQSPEGAVLTPELVDSFARSPQEYAANNTASDQSPVGAIEEVKGEVKVTRADGTVETATIGTPIYEGDIIETDATGAVNIVFIDETSMAISENARMAIDQYSFDPSTESGTTNFSVLRGLFVFTSGLIGRDDPDDVHINTPVGSIGIRGTIIAGQIDPDGESNISVLEGAIVVKNGLGETTLSDQFETVKLNGFDQPMESMGVVAASDITARFSSVGNVVPTLFSTINETVQQQQSADPSSQSSQPQSDGPSEQPASQQQEQQMQPQEAPQAPAAAPEPVSQLPAATTEIISLSNTNSGLPSASTVMGQADTLATGTNTTTISSTTASSSAIAPPPPPSTTTETAASTTTTPPAANLPPPPPAVIGGGTGLITAPPPPVSVGLTATQFSGLAEAGSTVATLSSNLSNVTYKFSASGTTISANGHYEIIGNQVKLTALGARDITSHLDRAGLSGFSITAIDPANASNTATVNHTPVIDTANRGYTHIADNVDNGIGYSITAMGDRNDDGFDDFMFSNIDGQNHVYTLYGNAAGLSDRTTPSGLTTTNPGLGANTSYTKIAGIGDFDGDGKQDYIIGQPNSDIASGDMSGNVAIISGDSPLTGGVPTEFITFNTANTHGGAEIGSSVSGVGDFNNDGYADVIIGAPNHGLGGAAYLVKGGSNWGSSADLDAASPTLTGTTNSLFGTAVAGIGDFNGDGYSDFAVGALGYDTVNINAGQVTIYSGNSTGNATILATISGTATNIGYGEDVKSVGDINGDGLSDIIFSAQGAPGKGYIVFGHDTAAPSAASITLDVGSRTIIGGGSVGDFNGDGYDDFAVTVVGSSPADVSDTYIVFGKGSLPPTINHAYLNTNAMKFSYSGPTSTDEIEVSGVGDVNGDGYDDFAMGVPDLNGATAGNGGVIVVYGRENATTGIVGTSGDDTLTDGGVAGKSLRGGAGDDMFQISNTNFLGIHGGSQTSPASIDSIKAMVNLDFSGVNFEKISGIEGIQFGASGQTITLTMENLFNLLKSSDNGKLEISSQGFSSLNLILDDGITGDGYTLGDTSYTQSNISADIDNALDAASGGDSAPGTDGSYNTFQIGGYKLLIDQSITVDAQ